MSEQSALKSKQRLWLVLLLIAAAGSVIYSRIAINAIQQPNVAVVKSSPVAASPALTLPKNVRYVTAGEFGDKWPLTVSSGYLRCGGASYAPPKAITFTVDGGLTYGVNGAAASVYPEIDPIWKDSPTPDYGPKIGIGPLIEAGLELCQ
jgi:Protein of unknown function (DUF2511)